MTHKSKILAAVLALSLAALACGVTINLPENAIEIGELVTNTISIPVPNPGEPAHLKLSFGTGRMILSPGAPEGLVYGTAKYNVTELAPTMTTNGNNIELKSGTFEYDITGLPNFGQIENTWDLQLSSHPMGLEIRAGAFQAELELGGLALQSFEIFGGASSININFATPNLVPMSTFHLTSGVTDAELTNLANANFSLFDFEGAGGNYVLDFSGTMQRDATATMNAGLSNIRIIVPAGVPATVNLSGNLNNVTIHGVWSGSDGTFTQSGEGPSLVFNIEMGAGQLTLDN
jgi:hypothetical protein